MPREIVDFDIILLEWNEVQQHWHIDHKRQEYDSDWATIASEIHTDVAGAFCDWVEETKIGFSDNRIKWASLQEMKEYWKEFNLILEILKDREIIKN